MDRPQPRRPRHSCANGTGVIGNDGMKGKITTRRRREAAMVVSPELNPLTTKRRKRGTLNNDEMEPDPILSSTTSSHALAAATAAIKIKGEPKEGFKTIHSTSLISTPRPRPTPEECEFVVVELGRLHPSVLEKNEEIKASTRAETSPPLLKRDAPSSCGFQSTVLDGVISTLLSQNTTAANSNRAFANLKRAFAGGDWNLIAKLPTPSSIETAIHCAGLAKKRAQSIWDLCKILTEERGEASLEYLRTKSSADIQEDLLRFRGLGKKTISCVLLFTLGRPDFPVDTHVHRISMQNNWIPAKFSRDDAYGYLNGVVPDHLKLDLHCLLVQHGRECHRCAARGKPQFPPKDGTKLACPLLYLNKFVSERKLFQGMIPEDTMSASANSVKIESTKAGPKIIKEELTFDTTDQENRAR